MLIGRLILFTLIGGFLIITYQANARNDYLNDRGCDRGSIELYSEFGYDTCHQDEKYVIMSKTIKLLQND